MKQVTQILRDGKLRVLDVPTPMLRPDGVQVVTAYSLISAGTERAKVEVAQKNLLGKAMERPDQVHQVIDTARQIGVAATYQKVVSKLDSLTPLGYSSAGIIVGVGTNVEGFAVGDRVACAGGGYANHAEVAYIPRNLCTHVPETVDLREAAFATLGAIALQGVRQGGPTIGESVGVIGLGLLGLLTVQILKAGGCRVIGVDIRRTRCALAQKLGADSATTPDDPALESLARIFSPAGLDSVILTAATKSSEPVLLAAKLARDRARIVVSGAVGMDIPRSPFYEKELDIRFARSYGPGRYDPEYEEKGHDYPIGYVRWSEGRNFSAFLDLIAQQKVQVKPLVTHTFAIDEAEQAYAVIEGKTQEPFLGVLLDYKLSDDLTRTAVQTSPISVTGRAEQASAEKVSVALIGAGNFAQSMLLPHLKTSKYVRLRSVSTSSGLTARSVAERSGFEQCTSDNEQIFSDPAVRLVVIASRHSSHANLVVRALEMGKAVFVEKPLALSQEQLQQVAAAYATAAQRGESPFVMVGFNRRFAPMAMELRNFIQRTREPLLMQYRVNAGYIARDHWTQDISEGGRILGEVCHFVDLLSFLAGQPVVQIYASALPDNGRYSNDNLAVTLRLGDGSLGTITYAANGDRSLEKERIEVFAGGQAAVLDDFRQLTLAANGKKTVNKSSPDKGHRGEMLSLIDAVRQGVPSPISFIELERTTMATLAIVESLRTGRPVEIGLP